MQRLTWTVALGLVFGVALPASGGIISGTLQVHGAEMS
jgi:hypothetical protein